jgi:hypothetical protein
VIAAALDSAFLLGLGPRRSACGREFGPPVGDQVGRDGSVRPVLRRYLIATIVFAVATVWTGVALFSALECLLAFVLASALVGVGQRRRLVAERGRARRHAIGRSHGRHADLFDGGERSYAGGAVLRARPSRALYDGDAERGDWPLLAERHW